MRTRRLHFILILLSIGISTACKHKVNTEQAVKAPLIFKGIYSCEPGAKTFQPCNKQDQFWVADSSKQLELQYSQMVNFEQSGQPVYAEVIGSKIKSDKSGNAAAYDSTLIVNKVIKITKDIPANCK